MARSDGRSETFPATLFDYNGVLADDEVVHLEAFRDALAPLGITISEQDYNARYLGFDDRGAFRAIISDSGRTPTEAEINELVASKKPLYRGRAELRLPLCEGAADLLQRRARLGPVGIVSGALRDEIMLGLAKLGAENLVQHIISAEDTIACKPDPEGYLIGIARLAAQIGEELAKRALVIEDSIAGVEAARAARLPCVAVTHSYTRAELERAGANLVVEHLDELSDDALAKLYRELG
jgi:HAD superfamily hydrolase (TIGR01509 family)